MYDRLERADREITALRQQLSEANAIIVKAQRLLELHVCDAPDDIQDYVEVMEYQAAEAGKVGD